MQVSLAELNEIQEIRRARQAQIMADRQRAAAIAKPQEEVIREGVGMVEDIETSTYDDRMIAVAASFAILIGKQFDKAKFLQEVGRLRVRRLPVIVADLTDAAGAYIVSEWVVEAPSDRHQLVMGIKFEVQGTDAAGVVQYRDMAQLDRLGIVDVIRPQSDAVPESWADLSLGAQFVESDPLVARPGGVYAEQRSLDLYRALPGGVAEGITWSFAALPSLNTLTFRMTNMAAAAVTAPSASLLRGILHVYVVDCIKGGN